ncbi:MAG: tRNA (adenosine(37)-N6)-threonylcarbamoyltransferase complex dimerization subunit type 1 TsaB [Thiohalomonadaceae bacterium]
MKILALESATESCSVALLDGAAVIARSRMAPREHAALLLPMVQEVLAEAGLVLAGLDAIAFGRGPGSFTGVRIAAGVTQGLAFAVDLPVLPVSTLAALAQGALRELGEPQVAAAIDARMGEVYWGLYRAQEGVMTLAGEEGVFVPALVPTPAAMGYIGYGSGWATYGDVLAGRCGITAYQGERFPQAEDLLPLAAAAWRAGMAVTAAEAQPIYLRDQVTHPRRGSLSP